MPQQYSYNSLMYKLREAGYSIITCRDGLTDRIFHLEVALHNPVLVYDNLEKIKKLLDADDTVVFQPVAGNVVIHFI